MFVLIETIKANALHLKHINKKQGVTYLKAYPKRTISVQTDQLATLKGRNSNLF